MLKVAIGSERTARLAVDEEEDFLDLWDLDDSVAAASAARRASSARRASTSKRVAWVSVLI